MLSKSQQDLIVIISNPSHKSEWIHRISYHKKTSACFKNIRRFSSITNQNLKSYPLPLEAALLDREELLLLVLGVVFLFGVALRFTVVFVDRVCVGATRVLFDGYVLVLFTEGEAFLGVEETRCVFWGGVAFTRVFDLVLFIEARCVLLVGVVFTDVFLVLFAETRCVLLTGAAFTGVLLFSVEILRCGAAFTGLVFRPVFTDGCLLVFVRTVPLFLSVVVALLRPVVAALFRPPAFVFAVCPALLFLPLWAVIIVLLRFGS